MWAREREREKEREREADSLKYRLTEREREEKIRLKIILTQSDRERKKEEEGFKRANFIDDHWVQFLLSSFSFSLSLSLPLSLTLTLTLSRRKTRDLFLSFCCQSQPRRKKKVTKRDFQSLLFLSQNQWDHYFVIRDETIGKLVRIFWHFKQKILWLCLCDVFLESIAVTTVVKFNPLTLLFAF